MNKHSASHVIQSLADVTSHADRELLDISLTSTLYELLKTDKITLFKILHINNEIECYLSIEVDDGRAEIASGEKAHTQVDYSAIPSFDVCLEQKKSVTLSIGDKCSILFPITDKLDNIISVFLIERSAHIPAVSDQFISGCFQIYQNYLNLLNDSERDTLTGLLNRRTFDRDLKKICSENIEQEGKVDEFSQRRDDEPPHSNWLAIADLDFFKRINDDFGHLYGDEVLILLANIMRQEFRGSDVLFRFGGEEFVIILRSTDLSGAKCALERFRKKVEKFEFPKVGQVTVSIGFIEISELSIPTEILGHADEALYFSKDNGRNQVNQYEQLVLDGKIDTMNEAEDDIELF